MTETAAELARTPAELSFLQELLSTRDWLDLWPRADADGTPWLCVSFDLSRDNAIQKTARADFDGSTLRGGWSPSCLNWDDGVRALDAGIDVDGADGLNDAGDPLRLAQAAGEWFDRIRREWLKT